MGQLLAIARRTASIRRWLICAVVVGVLGASGGVAWAISTNDSQPDLSAPSPSGMATSIPAQLSAAYPFLSAARQAADTFPADGAQTLSDGIASHYGVNPALAMAAGSVGGSTVWLVPGATGSCVYDSQSGGAECASNDVVTSQGIALTLVPVSGGDTTVVGVLPSGASVTATNATGTSVPVAQDGSAFYVVGAQGGSVNVQTSAAGTTSFSPPTSPGN